MTAEELLLELHDLQPPIEPGWWLLAPAWYTAIGLLLGLSLIAWLVIRHRHNNRLLVEAQRQLYAIRSDYQRRRDIPYTLQSVSAWLRQVAMAAYPDQQVAALTGSAWIEFLNRCSADPVFDCDIARILTDDLYQREIDGDAERIIGACESWLNFISARLRYRGGQHASA